MFKIRYCIYILQNIHLYIFSKLIRQKKISGKNKGRTTKLNKK